MMYRDGQPVPQTVPCAGCGRPMPGSRLLVRKGGSTLIVNAEDLTMLRAALKQLEVWTVYGLVGTLEESTLRMQERFPHLVRVSRSTLVDPQAIERIDVVETSTSELAREVVVSGVGPVRVARREWPHLNRMLS